MSENRFKEMYFHCLQYDEWKERNITDPQEEKRKAFKKRYRVVEETVRETHAKIYPWLLEAVTVEKATSEDRRQNDIEIIDDMLKDADPEEVHLIKIFVRGYLGE